MATKAGRSGLVLVLAVGILIGIGSQAANALGTITTLPSGFTWVGSKSATLSPTTGWTQIVSGSYDDNYQNIALGWNVTFEGVAYNTLQIHSNTYIGFANGGTTSALNTPAGYSQYASLTPNSPALPSIHMCSKDNSYQYVFYRFENSGTQLRVRYEGNNTTSGAPGSPTIVYEALFTANSSVIDIGMGINSSCDQNAGAGLLGITNGADAVLEANWPNATYSSGYALSTATGVKNNDYRISAGPTVTSFTTATSTPTNTVSPLSYTLTLSEASSGLAASDFTNAGTATGCTFATNTSSGTAFTITISSCGEGTVVPRLLANSVTGTSSTGPATNSDGRTTVIDRTSPTLSTLTTTNGNYSAALNANMNFTLRFSESVTVTGTPRLQLTIGSATEYANFISLTDSRTATFRFTVVVDYNDIDLDGISVSSPLQLNSGSISDLATNSISDLSFTPPVTTSVNVYQPPSAPTIDSITANSGSVTVSFTAGASNGSVVSNYKYSLNGGSYIALSPTDAISPITITGLTNGTSYQVQIRAVSNLGDGQVSNQLSATPTASATVNVSLTASATTASKGTTITITAQVSQAGVVTFFFNDKRISGCIKRVATSSATCAWKPSATGQWSVQALLDPTDPTYINSYSQKLPVFILRRSGAR
jgi:hypothetical protein